MLKPGDMVIRVRAYDATDFGLGLVLSVRYSPLGLDYIDVLWSGPRAPKRISVELSERLLNPIPG